MLSHTTGARFLTKYMNELKSKTTQMYYKNIIRLRQ